MILYSCSGVLRPYVSLGERIDKEGVPQSAPLWERKAACEYVMLLVGGGYSIFPPLPPPSTASVAATVLICIFFRRLHLIIDCVFVLLMCTCERCAAHLTRDRWRKNGIRAERTVVLDGGRAGGSRAFTKRRRRS